MSDIIDNFKKDLSEIISRRVKTTLSKYSQTQISALAGCTQSDISNLLNGKLGVFSLGRLIEIAANIGLEVSLTVSEV